MTPPSRPTFRRTERGSVGGVEGLAFGVLVFVFGTLLFYTAWGVVDAKLAASAAAREAGRAYVEATDEEEATNAARAAAASAMSGHGRALGDIRLDGDFGRCQPVRFVVTTHVPRVALPIFGSGGGTYTVTASHVERVDPYRSGLSGQAQCKP